MRFKATTNSTLLEIIKTDLRFSSNTKARNYIKRGIIKVDGSVVKIPSAEIKSGQDIEVDEKAKTRKLEEKTKHNSFETIFEDKHFIAFIKPSGLLSVSTKQNKRKEKNFSDIVTKQYSMFNGAEKVLHPINRLDRKHSGIMLFAKDGVSDVEIRSKWEESKKRYYAFVDGIPKDDNGKLESHLKQNRIGRVYSAPKSDYGNLCSLDYRVMYKSEKHSLLKIDVISDRKNSISAQLSEANTPIVGDKDYKGELSPINRFGLHLFSLSFYHPFEKKDVEIKTPVPKPFKLYFKRNKVQSK